MIGTRIRVARARAGMTMKSLGEAVGVTAQAIKRLEHDETMPSSKTFIALCKHLDVSAEWLMDTRPLDFHSTDTAPQGRHAKYWVREALAEIKTKGLIIHSEEPPHDQ